MTFKNVLCNMFYVMDHYEYRKLSNLAQNYSGWNSCASLDKRGKKYL